MAREAEDSQSASDGDQLAGLTALPGVKHRVVTRVNAE